MERWIIIYFILTVLFLIYYWIKDIYFRVKWWEDKEYLNKKLKEWDWLDNREVNDTIHQVNSWKTKEEPAEMAQPVGEPTTADILIKDAKEWKI